MVINYSTITGEEIYNKLTNLQQSALTIDEVDTILNLYRKLTPIGKLSYKLTRHTIALTANKRNKNGVTFNTSLVLQSRASHLKLIYSDDIYDLFHKISYHPDCDEYFTIEQHMKKINTFSEARKKIILRFTYEIFGFSQILPDEAFEINQLFKNLGIA